MYDVAVGEAPAHHQVLKQRREQLGVSCVRTLQLHRRKNTGDVQ